MIGSRTIWLALMVVAVTASVGAAVTPNDPLFPSQWESAKVGLTQAWEVTMGRPKVVIAVIDTGVVTTNRDLTPQLVPGWNVLTRSNVTNASGMEHGSHMAGIAAAAANNRFGMAGVAPGCRIMPVQVTKPKTGYASWPAVSAGLRWAADHGAKVALVPYAPMGSKVVEEGARYFKEKGGLVIVASGNQGKEIPVPDTDAWITVAATDKLDARWGMSNYGEAVDLAAPGAMLTTTSWHDLVVTNANSGTSGACAVVAGVAALVFSANPKLTPDEAERILKTTAVDLGAKGRDPYFGWGRVNAAAAVAEAKRTAEGASRR